MEFLYAVFFKNVQNFMYVTMCPFLLDWFNLLAAIRLGLNRTGKMWIVKDLHLEWMGMNH